MLWQSASALSFLIFKESILKLLDSIEVAFRGVSLGNAYTLLEEDFFDTHYRHFDKIDDQYLSANNCTPRDLLLKWGFDWPISSQEIAIKAIENRCRAENQFKSWSEVTYNYFCTHNAITFLSPDAFVYYLPAMMQIYLENYQSNLNMYYIDSFIFYIETFHQKIISLLTNEQLNATIEFLKFYAENYKCPNETYRINQIIDKLTEKMLVTT